MFKNLLVYRLAPTWTPDFAALVEALEAAAFVPCGATQPVSAGWVAPRGRAHAALAESIGGHWLCTLLVEQKVLPGTVVKRRVDALAARIEADTGRKPGKKQRKELKDQAQLELLPQAFTREARLPVWIAPQQGWLAIDAASAARADEVITLLTKGLHGFSVEPLHTALAPATAMAGWLLDGEPPAAFGIDRDCELKAPDESKAVVRYARHALDTEEVRAHVQLGKRPTRLALTWQGRVSFVLTEALALKKIELLDVVTEGQPSSRDADENFDADAAITTGELAKLIPELIEALGGEEQPGSRPAADALTDAGAAPPQPALQPALPPALKQATSPSDDSPPWV